MNIFPIEVNRQWSRGGCKGNNMCSVASVCEKEIWFGMSQKKERNSNDKMA